MVGRLSASLTNRSVRSHAHRPTLVVGQSSRFFPTCTFASHFVMHGRAVRCRPPVTFALYHSDYFLPTLSSYALYPSPAGLALLPSFAGPFAFLIPYPFSARLSGIHFFTDYIFFSQLALRLCARPTLESRPLISLHHHLLYFSSLDPPSPVRPVVVTLSRGGFPTHMSSPVLISARTRLTFVRRVAVASISCVG